MFSLNLQSLATDRKVVLKEYAAVWTPVMQPCTPKYDAVGVGGPALSHFKQLWLEVSKQVISKQSVGKCFP